MKINALIHGGKNDKAIFEVLGAFEIQQLKLTKLPNGKGIIEIKGLIDIDNMVKAENILNNRR